jgi:hypothetical protein
MYVNAKMIHVENLFQESEEGEGGEKWREGIQV